MLIEFSVENYRSFQEKQTLSMVAAEDDETMLNSNTFPMPNTDDLRLVTSAAIYGPNASGKSNLIKAIVTLKQIIVNSATRINPGDKLPLEPFRLNSESSNQPTIFEAIFIHKDTRYEYGISATQDQIHEEWLIAYPNEQQQNWFYRKKHIIENTESQESQDYKNYEWSFSEELKGENGKIKTFTRYNSLFLSHAAQNDHPQLKEIYKYFRDQINMLTINVNSKGFTFKKCQENQIFREKVVKILSEADIGIYDIRPELINVPEEVLQVLKGLINKEIDNPDIESIRHEPKAMRIVTVHKMNDSEDKTYELNMDEESDGTQRLFEMSGPWLDVLEKGELLIVDEIDRSLHPVLSNALIKMFNDPEINHNNAQLIFTTHDTTLLDEEIFRPDQIWFTEKDNSMTKLYSLLDFRPREDESLQKGYLLGRYGAIPFINGLSI
ncbi:MAG: AAA family ATPase [Sphaerospermopsis kisseleviana]